MHKNKTKQKEGKQQQQKSIYAVSRWKIMLEILFKEKKCFFL